MLAAAFGCDREERPVPASAPTPSPGAPAAMAPVESRRDDGRPRVAFLGDSLTAGYGLDPEEAFPAVVGRLLGQEDLPIRVLNAGVSGDTTAGGLRRLDWVLGQKPDLLVVGLGGNDGLRALPPEASEQNLRDIVRKCRERGVSVLLLGMLIPPNYGPEYVSKFREIYPRLANELDVPLVPFLLEGVGGDPSLNLSDGIHPTAEGHQRVARNVLPYLKDAIREQIAAAATRPATRAAQ